MHLPVSTDDDRRPAPAASPPGDPPGEVAADDDESDETVAADAGTEDVEREPETSDGPRASPGEREQMLRDTRLQQAVLRVLRKRSVPEADREDVMWLALDAAYAAPRLPGGGGRERDRYVQAIARNKAISFHRKRADDPELERAEELRHVAAPTVDAVADRDLLQKLMEVPLDDQRTLECLRRKWLGEKLVDIAADEGIPYDRLRKRVDELEARLRKRSAWMRKAGITIAMLVAIGTGTAWELRPAPPMAYDVLGPVSPLEPAMSTQVGEPDPVEWARVLRGQAFRKCMQNRWYEALQDLDAATEIDPDGEHDPIVAAARKDATEGYWAGTKPGSKWRPPVVRAYAGWAAR